MYTLLHKCSDSKPDTVYQSEVVFDHVRVWVAGVRVVPLVGCEPEGEIKMMPILFTSLFITAAAHIYTY